MWKALKKAREDKAEAVRKAEELLAKATTENRDFNEAETTEYDALVKRAEDLGRDIERRERLIQAAGAKPEQRGDVTPQPQPGREDIDPTEQRQQQDPAEQRAAFNDFCRTGELRATNTITSTTGSGAYVPKEVAALESVAKLGNSLKAAHAYYGVPAIPVTGKVTVSVPVIDLSDGDKVDGDEDTEQLATSSDASVTLNVTTYNSKPQWLDNGIITAQDYDAAGSLVPVLRVACERGQEAAFYTASIMTAGLKAAARETATASTVAFGDLSAILFDLGGYAVGRCAYLVSMSMLSAMHSMTDDNGYGANVVDGFRIVLKSLQLAFSWVFSKGIEAATGFAEAVAWVVNKAIEGINWVIKQANKLPKVNIPEIEMRLEVDRTMADAIIADQQQLRDELADDIGNLAKFDNAKKVDSFFDDIRAKAQANGEAIADNAKRLNEAGFNAEDFGEKLKQAEDNAKKVADTLGDLQKQVDTFGLSDSRVKLMELEGLGATPEQLQQAKRLMDLKAELEGLSKIDTGDSVTDFAAQMEQLQKLYAAGKVTAEQFAAIRDSAKTTLNDKLTEQARGITDSVKTPLEQYQQEVERLNLLFERGLITQETFDRATLKARAGLEGAAGSVQVASAVRAGSAEAQKLAFDNARGVQRLTKDDIDKKALAEAQASNRLLDRIARNTEGQGVALEEVDL